MPNHTKNRLSILNYDKSNQNLKNLLLPYIIKNDSLDFNKIIPIPKNVDGYRWSLDNWGTKWNSYDGYFENDDLYIFQTAWSPPIPVIQKLSELINIPLRISYLDEGYCYIGETIFQLDEEVVENVFFDVGDNLTKIPKHLYKEFEKYLIE